MISRKKPLRREKIECEFKRLDGYLILPPGTRERTRCELTACAHSPMASALPCGLVARAMKLAVGSDKPGHRRALGRTPSAAAEPQTSGAPIAHKQIQRFNQF